MIEIRSAHKSDAVELLASYNEANMLLGYPQQTILSTFEAMVLDNMTAILYEEQKDWGFISAKQTANSAFLVALYLRPQKQGQGLGSHLLSYLEAYLRQRTVQYLVLKALKNEAVAIRFYIKNKYGIVNEELIRAKGLDFYLPIKSFEYCLLKEL